MCMYAYLHCLAITGGAMHEKDKGKEWKNK